MSESTVPPTPVPLPAVQPRRSRLWWTLGAILAVLFGFTGWVAWQAQGLEERILAEVQPHLATDVHIEGLDVSLWGAWPDVEVRLRGVRIADALDPEADFLTLNRLDLTVACWPLLEDRLEVRSLQLSQGQVNLRRASDGTGNWVFWKTDESSEVALPAWRIASLVLDEVVVEGSWASGREVTGWSTEVQDAQVSLASGVGGALEVEGVVELVRSDLRIAEEPWLDQVGFSAEVNGRIGGDDVALVLDRARLSRGPLGVDVSGRLGTEEGEFNLALRADAAALEAVEKVLPPALRPTLDAVFSRAGGQADLDVVVGQSGSIDGPSSWAGPSSGSWGGVWAVRVDLAGTEFRERNESVLMQAGTLVAHDQGRGWKVDLSGVRAGVAGGEVQLNGVATGSGSQWQLGLDVEGIARPSRLVDWMSPAVQWPEGWRMGEEGQVRAEGRLQVTGFEDGSWSWTVDHGTHVSASGLVWNGHGAECGVGAVDFRWNASGWVANVEGVHVPGAEMSASLEQAAEGKARLDVAEADVSDVLNWWQDWSEVKVPGSDAASTAPWNISVVSGPLRHGSLSADRLQLEGRLHQGRLEVMSLKADAMGGQLEARGTVDRRRADFEGRMAEIDLPSFLEATDGLGQATLLPRHVRGTTWAQGHLGYDFQRKSGVPWDAQVTARIEDGELIEFDLLQEIPATLEADRKYRFIADADDMRRRLKRVRFEPLAVNVDFERDVLSLTPVTVASDAMDVGVEGWYRLGGNMDFTLDFALRDLKSAEGELGTVEEDGLGHRFFLAVGGTLEEPEFGYDRGAHQEHRRTQRQGAWNRLKGALQGEEVEGNVPESGPELPAQTVEVAAEDSSEPSDTKRRPVRVSDLDDEDDF